jgi:hypothetical protein
MGISYIYNRSSAAPSESQMVKGKTCSRSGTSKAIVLVAVVVVGAFGASASYVLYSSTLTPSASSKYKANEVHFVGNAVSALNTTRGSNVSGSFTLNLTQSGHTEFLILSEKYAPPGTLGNAATSVVVHTITSGFFTFNDMKLLISQASVTQPNTSTVTSTGPVPSNAGVFLVNYSFYVPLDAQPGLYSVAIDIISYSQANSVTLNGLATYTVDIDVR